MKTVQTVHVGLIDRGGNDAPFTLSIFGFGPAISERDAFVRAKKTLRDMGLVASHHPQTLARPEEDYFQPKKEVYEDA